MDQDQLRKEEDRYRYEAMGAFAHEIRTPLTSIRMVMELARRQSSDGKLLLDTELAEMLKASVDDLQHLADDLQEASRLERGKVPVLFGPCDLGAAVDAARELLGHAVSIEGVVPAGIEGPWDVARLVRAIAGFAESANRMGNGSGTVEFQCAADGEACRVGFSSGAPGASTKPIASDAGFAFFRSRQTILAMGGNVDCIRGERYARIDARLPWHRGGV
ncbi:MAG: hypothetical protein C0506_06075 [Anaerolinea sp.]|nr:hypothetical protein [Anaerolinea sp.]